MCRKLLLTTLFGLFSLAVNAQTTGFTYQGSLKDGANAANGNYDFEFALFTAVSGPSQLGSTLSRLMILTGRRTVRESPLPIASVKTIWIGESRHISRTAQARSRS